MRIGTRITLQFAAMVSLILGVVLVIIYSLSEIHSQNDFYDRLEERAFSAANIFLEQDEVTKERYAEFQKKYLQTLPQEIIQVFDERDSNVFIQRNAQISFAPGVLDRIRKERVVRVADGKRQAVGIYYEDNQGNFVILASAIDEAGLGRLDNLKLILVLCFLGNLTIVYLAGKFFSRRALNPIRAIVRQVRAITASKLDRRVDGGEGKDEIAELAVAFNDTLRRLELAFESRKTFISNASHELRTPLTAMIGEVEVLLSKERDKQDYASTLANVLREAEQLKELTNMLLSLARTDVAEESELMDIRLDEILWEVKEKVLAKVPSAQIAVTIDDMPGEPENLTVHGNRHLLISAFSNIVENALKFSDNRRVVCRMRCFPKSLVVTISDTGIGIAREDLAKIFQPFYRGENARKFSGHGIGLALTEKIIKLHGGAVSAESTVGAGTEVSITLPVNHF